MRVGVTRSALGCVGRAGLLLAALAAPAGAQDWFEGELPPIRHAPETQRAKASAPIADDAIDVRLMGGLGPGLDVRHWARQRQPGLPGHTGAGVGAVAPRYQRLFPLTSRLFVGVGGETFVLGAWYYRGAVYQHPSHDYVFASSQLAMLGTGVFRVASPTGRAHFQLDGGFGIVHARTWFKADWPDPSAPQGKVRGSTTDTMAMGRVGIELGIRMVRGWPYGPGPGPHGIFRLRLDWLIAAETTPLRLPGDSQASATYNPSAVMLSIGFGVAF